MAKKSYYSNIEIITTSKGKFIDKSLEIPGDLKYAQEIQQQILIQRSYLEEAGVPLSKLESINVANDSGKNIIRVREVFAGLDFMDIVDESNIHMYLQRLLENVYKPLLRSSSDDMLKAGIDPVMRNFVYDNHENIFRYVDFLPPKVFFKGKYTQEIPELTNQDFREIREFCHNSRKGIVYVTYINLVRVFPTQLKLINAVLEQFLESIGEIDLLEPIRTSPFYRNLETQALKKELEKIEDWKLPNYYYLRELANILLYIDKEFGQLHKEIYLLTHHVTDETSEFYGRVSPENFAKIKQILSSQISKLDSQE